MTRAIGFEEASSRAGALGLKLVEYSRVNAPATFACGCGNQFTTRFSSAIRGDSHCPECYVHKPHHPDTPDSIARRRKPRLLAQADISDGRHTCSHCGVRKPFADFPKRGDRPLGLSSRCCECSRELNRQYYWRNRELCVARRKNYVLENKSTISEYGLKWRARNKEKLAVYFREYNKVNRGKRNNIRTKRRATKLNATPSWAKAEAIEWFYRRAKQLERQLGTKFHVDHIVPLVNPLVCGLHCEHNLRVIPAERNLSKGNHFWPDMP